MPQFNLLRPKPFTRVNDAFVHDASLDATPLSQSRRHDMITGEPNSADTRFQAGFYRYAACDFVVETVFHYPYAYVSEKTLRPVACKRMFVICGPCGVLALLRAKGFATFGDFIDESYDNEADPVKRFQAVIREISGLCARPLQQIVQYLQLNQDRLDHNFDTLMRLQNQELIALKTRLK